MTNNEFRARQRQMDEAGLITHIRTIRVSKTLAKTLTTFDDAIIEVYRYKYRYEVILNGDIVLTCKYRKKAKDYLIELYNEKMALTSI